MKTNRTKRLVSLLMTAVLVFTGAFACGVPVWSLTEEEQAKVDELKQQKEDLSKLIDENQAKIDELKESAAPIQAYAAELGQQIDNYQQQIDVLVEEIAGLEAEKAGIEKQIADLDKDIAKINDDITKNEIETARVRDEIDVIYKKFKDRLCEIYVNGTQSDLEILLDCDDVNDFSTYLIMVEIAQRRAKNDEKIVEDLYQDIARIDELTAQYNAMKADLETKKQEHQAQVAALNVSEQSIEADKTTLEASQGELQNLKDEAFSQIAELDRQSEAAAKLIEEYEAEQADIEKEIDTLIYNRAAKSANVVINPGGYIWPLQYGDAYISSAYGYRYDPISGVYKLHGGTDTCCSSGTYGKEVVASADGTVIIASYMSGGYGYYVAIDHGGGVVTLYAHNSALNVSEGQHVSQGDVVAYAGSTGYATGAHCHFEFRINGERVDATDYASP